jgi:hypothetical protein
MGFSFPTGLYSSQADAIAAESLLTVDFTLTHATTLDFAILAAQGDIGGVMISIRSLSDSATPEPACFELAIYCPPLPARTIGL